MPRRPIGFGGRDPPTVPQAILPYAAHGRDMRDRRRGMPFFRSGGCEPPAKESAAEKPPSFGASSRKGGLFPPVFPSQGGGLPELSRGRRFFRTALFLSDLFYARSGKETYRPCDDRDGGAFTQKKRPPRATARGGRKNRLIPVPSDREPCFHGARFFRAFLSYALRAEPSHKGAYLPRSSP